LASARSFKKTLAAYNIFLLVFSFRKVLDAKLLGMHRPDIRLIQKPDTGYPVKALTNIFLVKYKIFFLKALTIIVFSKHKKSMI
jgi:hypothetical protein